MPIAFKEWAVTVRALAEGEQLLTLRKGGTREESRHFEIEHDRFFLYPTFDHQQGQHVRESHRPELSRALEEGVWTDGEPSASVFVQDGRIPRPVTVKVRDEYLGCRSWLELQRDLPFEGTPVLSDEEFDRAAEQIEAIASDAVPVLA